jgi:S-adenosyl methyltransferase
MTSTQDTAPPDDEWNWSADDQAPNWVPPEIDTTRPSPARMYDFALGGKDNFEIDRRAVEQVAAVLPNFRKTAQDNRHFLVEAVRQMAAGGIRQFIDLGTGIPTSPNVHETARERQPDAHVVYVDNDPMVTAHNRALRATVDGVITLQHDVRNPETILEDPQLRELIDFEQPVGVLFIAVLHFVRRDLAPEVVARFRSEMAPGSHLAISAACTDGMDPGAVDHIENVYRASSSQIVFRTGSQIEQLFDGFEILDPGLRDIAQWRQDTGPSDVRVTAGLARLP